MLGGMGSRNTRNREMGERIRQLRESRGMTLVAVSKAAGYPYSWQLSKVELDGVMPDPERLTAIADALGSSVEFLLTGERSRAATPPPPHSMDEWLEALGDEAPPLALEMARSAWNLAHGTGATRAARPAQTPTLTPPARSASQSLAPPPPTASGMRSKRGAAQSSAPRAMKRRAR